MKKIKFTIITVCFNSEKTLSDTITSVINQTYNYYDYLIIDGDSTDNTLQIAKEYTSQYANIVFFSEQDKGLYDAMNKAVNMVRDAESYIIFLNSDDIFYDKYVLEEVANTIENEDIVYGKVEMLLENQKYITGHNISYNDLFKETICHQAIFAKKLVFDKIGLFNLEYKIAADRDFLFRAFHSQLNIKFINVVISSVQLEGLANKNASLARKEYFELVKKYSHKNFSYFISVYFPTFLKICIVDLISRLGLDKVRRKIKYKYINTKK